MLKSDYDLTGGQQFTVKVAKQTDGSFQASVPAAKGLGTFSADSQNRVVQKANDAIAAFVTNNYEVKTSK